MIAKIPYRTAKTLHDKLGNTTSVCGVVSALLSFMLGGQGSSLGRTFTQGLKIIGEKGLVLH